MMNINEANNFGRWSETEVTASRFKAVLVLMSRTRPLVVAGSMLAGYTSVALAASGHCPSAPQTYDATPCNNYCVRDPADATIMECDISAQSGDNDVVVVKNYRNFQQVGTASYSAWGTADGVNFCCTLLSGANNPVNAVRVLTGSGDDEIWFTAFDAGGNEKNLSSNPYQTTAFRFTGYAYPGDGRDRVYGSNSRDQGYLDFLTGENGADIIHGNKGADFLSVAATRNFGFQSIGNSGESVYGDNGRDEIVGATNNIAATDVIFVDGGNQNDLLCTGAYGALTAQQVYFFGGAGNDQIYSMSSFIAGFAGNIDGGPGNDGCDNPGGGLESNCETSFNSASFTAWTPIVCN